MDTRITICLTEGVLRGASHTADNGLPTELDLSALAALAPEINTAALARIAEIEADAKTATDDHAAAVAALNEQIASLPTLQSRIAELEAQVVALTPPAVPPSIKAWQAKAVLALAGLLESEIEMAIAAMDEPQRTVALSAWTNNADFARTSPTIAALGSALGLTDEQLDGMFAQAAALTV